MTQEVELDGVLYISSKRAAEMTGYTQDYVGQLARASLIDAKRISGLWYVNMSSLNAYKDKAETFVPTPPQYQKGEEKDLEQIVGLDGRTFISSSRASKLTGYHADYIGQLARAGRIISRQVGNRWYVDQEGLLAHKKDKDSLLGAVQADSVGISRPSSQSREETSSEPFFTYVSEQGPTMPMKQRDTDSQDSTFESVDIAVAQETSPIPIHVLKQRMPIRHQERGHGAMLTKPHPIKRPKRRLTTKRVSVAVLTMAIVIVAGFSIHAIANRGAMFSASASVVSFGSTLNTNNFLVKAGEFLEKLFPPLVYSSTSK